MKGLMLGLALLATPALAQTPAVVDKSAAVISAENADAKGRKLRAGEQVVCKTIGVTGSRLNTRKTCRTTAEWDRMAEIGRKETERGQRPLWNCSVCAKTGG